MDKVKFTIEFPINSSKGVLYNCMSTPSGLSEWFCDDVNIKKDMHTFIWDGAEEEGENTFFELRIKVDDMTGDRAIIVTDFAEEDEIEDSKELWMAQLENLKRVLGG